MGISDLFENSELTLQQIADHLGITYKVVWKYVAETYSKQERCARKALNYRRSRLGWRNPAFGLRGEESKSYKGLIGDQKGYLLIIKPGWYTGRKNSKHVFYHSVVVCSALGLTEVPHGWCVHHCDKNPHNNEFSNLVLITLADHTKLHSVFRGATTISKESTLKWVEAHGTPFRRDDIVCSA